MEDISGESFWKLQLEMIGLSKGSLSSWRFVFLENHCAVGRRRVDPRPRPLEPLAQLRPVVPAEDLAAPATAAAPRRYLTEQPDFQSRSEAATPSRAATIGDARAGSAARTQDTGSADRRG